MTRSSSILVYTLLHLAFITFQCSKVHLIQPQGSSGYLIPSLPRHKDFVHVLTCIALVLHLFAATLEFFQSSKPLHQINKITQTTDLTA
ncbi:hypothetical protein F4778DRAFT_739188 [Xylariomycetidae sp. FL2044]|nr:hypothetical protein F4778DRAFT_739188 [Xylariomycetidae sp. FL2044]